MEQGKTGFDYGKKSPIDLKGLLERIKVLLPLIRGWNPDILVAVNPDGLILAGILSRFLQRDVEALLINQENGEYSILSRASQSLGDKRVLLLIGRFPDETMRSFIERFLQQQRVASLCHLVILGKGVEYCCFPEYPETTQLPWEGL